jgi:uncharacterized protein YbjT (DUF2867 family)
VVGGDLSDPTTVVPHLRGVDALYLVAMGGDPSIITLAEEAGVRRVVLLSTGDVMDGVDSQIDVVAERHRAFEEAAENSSMTWTFLRPNEFAGNALQWANQIRTGDIVRAPYKAAKTAAVHELDIAEVAVLTLVSDGHHGMKYVLTGPETLSHEEQVHRIGRAIGRRLTFEEIPAADFRASMVEYAPAAVVDAVLAQLHRAVTEPHLPTPTVRELLGREARSFTEWATDHASEFRRK